MAPGTGEECPDGIDPGLEPVSAVYRVQQFFRAAGAWLRPSAGSAAQVGCYLTPQAVDLFRAMPRYDRRHALNVLHTLRERGYSDPELLAAALLHDVGKTAHPAGGLRLWHRVAVVLLDAFWPGLLERLGEEQHEGWRRPFYVQLHHAAIGAELAQQIGCSPGTVDLIRRHESPSRQAVDARLAALQAADDVN
jgi:putative nucleotidyltransferase with HDIG domain